VLLSIVVPIYCKPPQFLRECIESILVQSFTNFELILINDASPDDPGELLLGYALGDRRIKLVHFHSNRGVAAARNFGVRMAQGKYIAFIDADDSVDVLYFETLITIIEQFSLDIVVATTNDFCTTEQLKPIRPFCLSAKIENIPLRTLSVQHFICRLFRRFTIESLTFDEHLHVGEDILFIHRAMLVATKCMAIDYRGYHYRHPPKDLIQNYFKKFTSGKQKQPSLLRKISEMLYLIDQLLQLKNFAKNKEDIEFVYYFSLRRFLRYSNLIWKLKTKDDQKIYWQKFCALFQEKFSKEMSQVPCLNIHMSLIFSRSKPFFGVRFFLYWARVLWEIRHVKQNFHRLTCIFKLAWRGYVC
jgi:glycosyltransferase involved in cell wall biosynthesis